MSDLEVRGDPGGATARDPRGSDTLAKSYRYLRTAMAGLLLCLAAAVVYQSVRQDDLLSSVSAYYYTPAQGIFVGALIGLGACMIALQGTTLVEDIFLNLGGVCAAIVAVVPTARDADYQAAVRACQQADTPLLTDRAATEPDCPTVQALADATRANVENNLSALLIVGVLALLATLAFAWKDGTLGGHAGRTVARKFWAGFAAATALWLAGLVARLTALQWLIDNVHFVAAAGLFVCILVVVMVNARRAEDKPSGTASRARQSVEAVGELAAVTRRHDRYIWIARIMLLVAAGSALLMVADVITLFWLEIAVTGLFIVFWIVQTVDLD